MSPVPNLIHPVPVLIEQIDKRDQETSSGDGTWFDDDFREPVQQVTHGTPGLPPISCPGQVKWGMDEELRATLSGALAESDGYVLFRYVDLEARSLALQQNDRFTKLGTLDSDVYIVGFRPEGHYEDVGGPTLVKAFFKSRQPSRQGVA